MSGLPARHSFRLSRADFRGQKTEASPYPLVSVLRHQSPTYRRALTYSASSLVALTGKPFGCFRTSGLSWLSYSPSGFPRTPSVVIRSVPPVARSEAPHAGHVERSLQSRTP